MSLSAATFWFKAYTARATLHMDIGAKKNALQHGNEDTGRGIFVYVCHVEEIPMFAFMSSFTIICTAAKNELESFQFKMAASKLQSNILLLYHNFKDQVTLSTYNLVLKKVNFK